MKIFYLLCFQSFVLLLQLSLHVFVSSSIKSQSIDQSDVSVSVYVYVFVCMYVCVYFLWIVK